ncbi:hypothetical protein FJ970_11405 [Mesorhizobium sp. B2-1-8]|uniref:hypothetical protein n=1 Tax=Mesorhizobium sp. B2-1-8 TaxID=2589967 RepID=UPI00112DCFE3|nr:hypothetical protein [Mesorhizobium sp. B2-1-8]UCI21518.1 hypothetical protein FJ970_11405 [Mesorhizobium sp. B2-1-8]
MIDVTMPVLSSTITAIALRAVSVFRYRLGESSTERPETGAESALAANHVGCIFAKEIIGLIPT